MAVTTIRGGRQISDATIPYADIQNVTANTVLCNNTTGATSIQEVALSTNTLLGRGSTGNIAAISVGTGLSFSGTTLNATLSPVGTPVANQVALWTGATTVQGLASLTYNGTSWIQGTGGNESFTQTVNGWSRSRSTTANRVYTITGATGASGGSAILNAGDTIRIVGGAGNNGAGGNGGDVELVPGTGFVGQAGARGGIVTIFKLTNTTYTFANESTALYIKTATSGVSSVSNTLRLISDPVGALAIGVGVGMDFQTLTATSNFEIGTIIESVSTNISSGTEAFDFVVRNMSGGASAAERMRVKSTGQLQLAFYTGSGSFTGTAAGYLAFDSSGNILTVAVPSGGGVTTLNTLTAATQTFANDTNVTITSATSTHTLGWTGQLAVSRGGTGVSSVTTSPTASAFAGWDANRNLSADNFIEGYATTATAGGTTTLTVDSNYFQYFTGTTTQTVTLPVVTTLVNGFQFQIVNQSTGIVTVQTSGANTIMAMGNNTVLTVTCVNTAGGTGTASWTWTYNAQRTVSVTTAGATLTPNITIGDVFTITAQDVALAVANPTGTPVNGQRMIIRIKDNGTLRSITWSGSQYRASSDLSLPTTTIASRTQYLGFIWNSTDSRWDLLARLDNFA
jgi:hypothetical protein